MGALFSLCLKRIQAVAAFDLALGRKLCRGNTNEQIAAGFFLRA